MPPEPTVAAELLEAAQRSGRPAADYLAALAARQLREILAMRDEVARIGADRDGLLAELHAVNLFQERADAEIAESTRWTIAEKVA